jgi:hypothetical protein
MWVGSTDHEAILEERCERRIQAHAQVLRLVMLSGCPPENSGTTDHDDVPADGSTGQRAVCLVRIRVHHSCSSIGCPGYPKHQLVFTSTQEVSQSTASLDHQFFAWTPREPRQCSCRICQAGACHI